MRKRAEPTTLFDAALLQAIDGYQSRMSELLLMRSSLGLLDGLTPALRERGLQLAVNELHWYPISRAVGVTTKYLAGHRDNQKLLDALLDLGFTLLRHENLGTRSWAHLKRGELAICVGELPLLESSAAKELQA